MYHKREGAPESHAWGVILADATRHIAAALESAYAMNSSQVQSDICREYLEELGEPTSEATGDFVNRRLS